MQNIQPMGLFTIAFFKPNAKKASAIYEREFQWYKEAKEWADAILKESSIYYCYELTTPTPKD